MRSLALVFLGLSAASIGGALLRLGETAPAYGLLTVPLMTIAFLLGALNLLVAWLMWRDGGR